MKGNCAAALNGAPKTTMVYRTLEKTDLRALHSAFASAFSDYQVNMDFPFSSFERMMRRRGLVPELSVGAFEGDTPVGFSLTALRSRNGVSTAYDIATGVVPKHRRQGITNEIFLREKALLNEHQVGQYLLEVIKENLPAVRLYQKQGFQIQREFSCFQINRTRLKLYSRYPAERTDGIDLEQGKSFWDFEPSWQNSVASVSAAPEAFCYNVARLNGEVVGYGIIERKTGDIPQIAVNPKFRRAGVGTSLLAELAKNTEAEKLRVLNIEASQNAVLKFLTALGFEHSVSQYEMVLKWYSIGSQKTSCAPPKNWENTF
jgi:ribosomal protein S18 acetylase RimI-like enzyme